MKIYIAGPMTGYGKHNCPAFDQARNYLRSLGNTVISPPDITRLIGDDPEDTTVTGTPEKWAFYMKLDLQFVMSVDAVYVLPGWERSRGARIEALIAQSLGIPVFDLSHNKVTSKVITSVEPA